MAQAIHELKCWPVWFEAMWAGDKVAEVRKDDGRGYQAGDKCIFREFQPAEAYAAGHFTGRVIEATITHVLDLKDVPVDFPPGTFSQHDVVVLSLRITWRESRPQR